LFDVFELVLKWLIAALVPGQLGAFASPLAHFRAIPVSRTVIPCGRIEPICHARPGDLRAAKSSNGLDGVARSFAYYRPDAGFL
jgi:hypothetical protein